MARTPKNCSPWRTGACIPKRKPTSTRSHSFPEWCAIGNALAPCWSTSRRASLHFLNVAQVTGQIIDPHAPQVHVASDLRENRSPHRHFARAVPGGRQFLARYDLLHAHQRKHTAIADRNPSEV